MPSFPPPPPPGHLNSLRRPPPSNVSSESSVPKDSFSSKASTPTAQTAATSTTPAATPAPATVNTPQTMRSTWAPPPPPPPPPPASFGSHSHSHGGGETSLSTSGLTPPSAVTNSPQGKATAKAAMPQLTRSSWAPPPPLPPRSLGSQSRGGGGGGVAESSLSLSGLTPPSAARPLQGFAPAPVSNSSPPPPFASASGTAHRFPAPPPSPPSNPPPQHQTPRLNHAPPAAPPKAITPTPMVQHQQHPCPASPPPPQTHYQPLDQHEQQQTPPPSLVQQVVPRAPSPATSDITATSNYTASACMSTFNNSNSNANNFSYDPTPPTSPRAALQQQQYQQQQMFQQQPFSAPPPFANNAATAPPLQPRVSPSYAYPDGNRNVTGSTATTSTTSTATTRTPHRPPPPPPPPVQWSSGDGGVGKGSASVSSMSSMPRMPMQAQMQPPPPPLRHPAPPQAHMPMPSTPAPQYTLQPQQRRDSGGGGLDLSHVPRPPLITFPQPAQPSDPHSSYSSNQNLALPIYYTRQALHGVVPPLADTRFQVVDDGNASPLMMRSSFYKFPQHRGIWHETGDLPIGVLCTPLAVGSEDFVPAPRLLPNSYVQEWKESQSVPVIVTTQGVSPPRCTSCQAYANPFVDSSAGVCNFCSHRGNMLSSAFGTVDYEVDGPYVTRDRPVQPVFLYALDVTCPDVFQYVSVLEQVAYDLLIHTQRQPKQLQRQTTTTAKGRGGHESISSSTTTSTPRMGVCLFSSAGVVVHSLLHHQQQQQQQHERHHRPFHNCVVMSDVTEQPFSPLPLEEWTIEISSEQGFENWKDFLTNQLVGDIKYWKGQIRNRYDAGMDSCDLSVGGAALAFLAEALQESGGRGTILTWRRPNFGVGRLSHREERLLSTMDGKREDYSPYTPVQLLTRFKTPVDAEAARFYTNLGAECAKNRVSLDVVMHCDCTMGQTFLDLATFGELCRVTCGKLVWIPDAQDWRDTLQEELRRQVQSFTGWDAVFKLRCSAGINIKSFVSNTGIVQESLVGSLELELSSVSPSTTVAVELSHRVGGIPKGNKFVYLQSALLYTTNHGKRRVRVSTLALPVSAAAREVYSSIDFSATTALIMRRAAVRLHQIPSEDNATPPRGNTRAAVYSECLHVLVNYRKVAVGSSNQLLLPERFQMLPLFCMSLMKSPMLRPTFPFRIGSTEVVILRPCGDERAYFTFYAAQASPASAMLLVYPRIYPVTGLEHGLGVWVESPGPETSGFVYLPNAIRPSMEVLEDDGIYLIDCGLKLYLWMGRGLPDHIKEMALVQPLAEWNPVASRIVWQLHAFNNADRGHESELRPVHAPIVAVTPHDGAHPSPIETTVLDLMIEDAIGGERDYGEFLIRLHKGIRDQLHAKG